MAWDADKIKKVLDPLEKLGENGKKLVETIMAEVKSDDDAGLLNQLLDEFRKKD